MSESHEAPILSDASARAAALDPNRSFIVQAPAGSGKTELLTQRYLRLLAGAEAPEQILAITFTRKAAAEMRARVLSALEDAREPGPQSPHKRITWELASAVRSADNERQWHLAEHPTRLRIQTIDALNSSLSRRLPVLAGVGAALEPTDDAAPLYEAATRRLIERLGRDPRVSAPLEVLIVHLANRVDRLVLLLGDLLAKRDQWLHLVMHARAATDLRELLQATLGRVVQRHLTSLCKALGQARRQQAFELLRFAAENLLANPSLGAARRALLERCLARQSPPDVDADSLNVWRGIVDMLFKSNGELYSAVNKTHGFPTTHRDHKDRISSLLRSLATDEALCEQLLELRTLPDPLYGEEQWQALQALLDLLPEAVAELQLVFQHEGRADYVEIALRALRALGSADEPTDLALVFDYRLQHILVDEFQDTSFAQLDLLERLTAGWTHGDGRTLFCVGDPMQSIYRFRQADVGLFIELQQHGLHNVRMEPLRLEANFRSTPSLVTWVNEVFPRVLAPNNDPEQGAVRYSPSTAALSPGAGGVTVHAFVNGNEDIEAARVAEIVADTLQRDATGRIAVLVSARTHVGPIADALNRRCIQFQAVEIEQLRERPVVQDLIALTRALVHLADRSSWLAILRAPWCGLSLPDLHVLAAQPTDVVHDAAALALDVLPVDLFDSAALSADGRARLQRAHTVLSVALGERGRWPLRIWIERAWNALGGPATLARPQDLEDAEAYFRRLETLEIAGDLTDIARLDEQLQRLFASGRAGEPGRVEIMTIHAAKGLEFDTVILPGLQRQTRSEDRELLRWTRIAGADGGIVLAPIKAQGGEGDPIYRWIELLERQRVLRERARLLYVAATRAKCELHLLGRVQATVRDGVAEIREPRKGSMLSMLWSAVARRFDTVEPESSGVRSSALQVRQQLRRLPLGWSVALPQPALSALDERVVDMAEQPVFDWVSETSRHIGTVVHRELDRLCRATSRHSDVRAARQRLSLELAELGVPADRCQLATERAVAAIESTLADPRGRWLLGIEGGITEAASELALSGVVAGRVVEGVIDRTFLDAEGTRWIVDFKTSTHEGSGLEQFLDEEIARYRPQLTRYAQLLRSFSAQRRLRAALYFPLLRQWREVPLFEIRDP